MLPIIEKHEPVPSDDGTMLVTLSDGRREWSVPVTAVRHRGRLAAHVYRAARARGVAAQRRAANNFRAPPAVTATAGGARIFGAFARAPQVTPIAIDKACKIQVNGQPLDSGASSPPHTS